MHSMWLDGLDGDTFHMGGSNRYGSNLALIGPYGLHKESIRVDSMAIHFADICCVSVSFPCARCVGLGTIEVS